MEPIKFVAIIISLSILGSLFTLWLIKPFVNVWTEKDIYTNGETIMINYAISYLPNIFPVHVRADYLSEAKLKITYENGTLAFTESIPLSYVTTFYISNHGTRAWDGRWGTMTDWNFPNITGIYKCELLGREIDINMTD